MNKSYQVIREIVLDWSHMDLLGHVNNVHYFTFIQGNRIQFFDSLGMGQLHPEMEQGPIVAKTSCSFKFALHFPDTTQVRSFIQKLGNSSVIIEHHIFNGKNELSAIAEDVVVLYNFKKGEKIALSEEVKAQLLALRPAL